MTDEIGRRFVLDMEQTAGSHLHMDDNLLGNTTFEVLYRPAGPRQVGRDSFEGREVVTVNVKLGMFEGTFTPELWNKINAEVQGMIDYGRRVTATRPVPATKNAADEVALRRDGL